MTQWRWPAVAQWNITRSEKMSAGFTVPWSLWEWYDCDLYLFNRNITMAPRCWLWRRCNLFAVFSACIKVLSSGLKRKCPMHFVQQGFGFFVLFFVVVVNYLFKMNSKSTMLSVIIFRVDIFRVDHISHRFWTFILHWQLPCSVWVLIL